MDKKNNDQNKNLENFDFNEENSTEKLLNFIKEDQQKDNHQSENGDENLLDEYEKLLKTFNVSEIKNFHSNSQNNTTEKNIPQSNQTTTSDITPPNDTNILILQEGEAENSDNSKIVMEDTIDTIFDNNNETYEAPLQEATNYKDNNFIENEIDNKSESISNTFTETVESYTNPIEEPLIGDQIEEKSESQEELPQPQQIVDIKPKESMKNKQKYYKPNKNKKSKLGFIGRYFNFNESYLIIELGEQTTKIIQINPKKYNIVEIKKIVFSELPPEIIEHPERKEALLIGYLKNLIESNNFDTKNAYILLGAHEIISRRIDIPVIAEDEMDDAVGWELNKMSNIDIENSFYNYIVISDSIRGKSILSYIAKKEYIYTYENIFHEIGVGILGFLPISHSIASIYKQQSRYRDANVCHIEIGAKTTLIIFIYKGKIVFSREILTGGQTITEALMAPLAPGEGRKQITIEEAEELKKEVGIPTGDLWQQSYLGISYSQISILIMPIIERLLGSIQRTIEYVRVEYKLNPPDLFTLSGGTSQLKNLREEMEKRLNNNVEILNAFDTLPLQNLEIEKYYEKGHYFPSLIGTIYNEDKNKINLLPMKKRAFITPHWIKFYQKITLPLLTVAILISLVLSYQLSITYEKNYLNLKNNVAKLENNASNYDKLSQEIKSLTNKLDWLAIPQPINFPWKEIFTELNGIVKDDIYITDIQSGIQLQNSNIIYSELPKQNTEQDNTDPGLDSPDNENPYGDPVSINQKELENNHISDKGISIEGIIISDNKILLLDKLTNFLLRLEESPFFKNVFLEKGEIEKNQNILNFKVLVQYE